jgi:hypothetical protein
MNAKNELTHLIAAFAAEQASSLVAIRDQSGHLIVFLFRRTSDILLRQRTAGSGLRHRSPCYRLPAISS